MSTGYPFDGKVEIRVLEGGGRFPIFARVPQGSGLPDAGQFRTFARDWKPGETIELDFPLATRLSFWENEAVAGMRGPLPAKIVIPSAAPSGTVTRSLLICSSMRCAAAPALTDRRGERFPVLRVWGCRSELQNAKTLWLADRDEYRRIGLSYARLRFTTETAGECVRVFKAYLGQDDFVPAGITRGLFSRGVE